MNPVSRKMIRLVNSLATWLYRRTNGRIAGRGQGRLPVLLLTVPGRRTGRLHTVPVVYFEHRSDFIVVGTGFNGANASPQWFQNLAAARAGRIQVRKRAYNVAARLAAGPEREKLWSEISSRAPHFAEWQTKLGHTLPVVILTPHRTPP